MGVTSIRLQPEIESPLENLAIKLDRSKNYIINQSIKEYLERKGSADQRWSETLEAIDSVKSGKVIDEIEVHEWLESWGSNNELKRLSPTAQSCAKDRTIPVNAHPDHLLA